MQDRDKCVRCSEPVESETGIIDLDSEGVCQACKEHEEKIKVIAEDDRRCLDHDHSMF